MRTITFKTITKQSFDLEFEDDQTVEEMKKKIAKNKGEKDFPVEGQKLAYRGRLLADNVKASELNFDDGEFLIIMVTKQREATNTTSWTTSEQSGTTSEQSWTTSEHSGTTLSNETHHSNTEPSKDEPTATTLEIPPEHQQKVADIQALGYPRDEVIRALRASFYNPLRAVQYLCTGILVGGGEGPAAPANAGGQLPVTLLTITFTQEDRAALQRLRSMGFPEQLVLEAYIACDKQEELALEYILESLDEFNQDQDQGGGDQQ